MSEQEDSAPCGYEHVGDCTIDCSERAARDSLRAAGAWPDADAGKAEHVAFYEEHYSDWTVHALPLMVYVPTKDSNRDEAAKLVREILHEAAFDIRVSMTAEHSSEEGGEGLRLTAAEREAVQDSSGAPGRLGRKHFEAVERILADRLAAVQAERRKFYDEGVAHGRECGVAERDDLRGRLAALADRYAAEGAARDAAGKPAWPNNVARDLRAALANPSAAQGEGEA